MVEEARRRSTCCGVRNLLLGLLGGLLLGGLLGRLLLVAALLGSLLRASLGGLLGSSLGHVDEVLGFGEFFSVWVEARSVLCRVCVFKVLVLLVNEEKRARAKSHKQENVVVRVLVFFFFLLLIGLREINLQVTANSGAQRKQEERESIAFQVSLLESFFWLVTIERSAHVG